MEKIFNFRLGKMAHFGPLFVCARYCRVCLRFAVFYVKKIKICRAQYCAFLRMHACDFLLVENLGFVNSNALHCLKINDKRDSGAVGAAVCQVNPKHLKFGKLLNKNGGEYTLLRRTTFLFLKINLFSLFALKFPLQRNTQAPPLPRGL